LDQLRRPRQEVVAAREPPAGVATQAQQSAGDEEDVTVADGAMAGLTQGVGRSGPTQP